VSEAPPPGNGFPGINGEPLSAAPEPLHRLADAVRRISAASVGLPISDEAIGQAADQLTQVADRLEARAEPGKRPRQQPDPTAHPQDFFPSSPMIGLANPIAPPVEIWAVEGEEGQREIRGRVTFGYQYEGPPTCVHGGVIAELFDEVLGSANIIANRGAMTGTLTVRYRKPTPLLAQLDVVARMTRTEGRKIYTWAAIYHRGVLTAEADGIFIEMQPSRMLEVITENARESPVLVIDPAFAQLIADKAAN
jgi:hypothetical protein